MSSTWSSPTLVAISPPLRPKMPVDDEGLLSLLSPPTLPNEIKTLIIGYLETTADLLNLLLVNSEFREIVEKVLYRDVSFDCTSSSSSPDCPCNGCLRTIRSRPAAAAAVRSFEVFLPTPMPSCLEEHYCTFPYMANLEELVILSMNPEDVWVFEGVAFPKLRYYRGPPTALSRMSDCGSLWALKVSDYAIDTSTLLETVIPLTDGRGRAMVHLSLQLKDDEWRNHMTDIAQGFPNLSTLSIEFPDEIEEDDLSAICESVSRMPLLRCFRILPQYSPTLLDERLASEGWRLLDQSGVWITRVGRRFDVLNMEEENAGPARASAWRNSALLQSFDEMQKIWEGSSSVAKQDLPATWGG
ncbi:hypothetical protein FRB90_012068 [Tulasnella sp. 427]|nr:hypothetical protein FRB90_012068 [Tulasnella sp. 427]